MKIVLLALLGITGVIGGIGAVEAEDFTFTVPVRLSNLHPDAKEAVVRCNVNSNTEPVAGPGVVSVPLASGGFSGSVVVKVNAYAGKDPSTAVKYWCDLVLKINNFYWGPSPDSSNIAATPKPGTPFTRVVEGTLPQ